MYSKIIHANLSRFITTVNSYFRVTTENTKLFLFCKTISNLIINSVYQQRE